MPKIIILFLYPLFFSQWAFAQSSNYKTYVDQSYYGLAVIDGPNNSQQVAEVRIRTEEKKFFLDIAQSSDSSKEKTQAYKIKNILAMSDDQVQELFGNEGGSSSHLDGFFTQQDSATLEPTCPCLIFKREDPKSDKDLSFALSIVFNQNIPDIVPGLYHPDKTLLFSVDEAEYSRGELFNMAAFLGAAPSEILKLPKSGKTIIRP